MRVKRYQVRDMHEAMKLIRLDLGPEAVILDSRKVRQQGWRGMFLPRYLEVTAAIDEKGGSEQSPLSPTVNIEAGLKQDLEEVKEILRQMAIRSAPAAPGGIDRWRNLLQDLEFNNEVILYLLEGLEADLDAWSEEQVISAFVTKAQSILGSLEKVKPQKGKVVTLVGPTGVGKTTTLAKLAARFSLFEGRRVALATIDTYRIGAVEQLKTYGDILGVPVEVALTPKELRNIVERNGDKDIILVDTAGRPSYNAMQLQELRGFLEVVKPLETYLVLSSNTKNRDLLRMARDFRVLDYNHLVFTKIDETETLGPLLNVSHATGVPVSFITNGQRVPEDLLAVQPRELAEMIIKAVV